MRYITTAILALLCLAGCASGVDTEPQSWDYIPRAWLETDHVDSIMQANPSPAGRAPFETTDQFEARVRVAQDRLGQQVEIPVTGTLQVVYDPDLQEAVLPLNSSTGFWSDWQALNGVSVFDRGADYPVVRVPMALSLARDDFDPDNFGVVLVGVLQEYPNVYLSLRADEVLVYDRRSLRVLARDDVRNP